MLILPNAAVGIFVNITVTLLDPVGDIFAITLSSVSSQYAFGFSVKIAVTVDVAGNILPVPLKIISAVWKIIIRQATLVNVSRFMPHQSGRYPVFAETDGILGIFTTVTGRGFLFWIAPEMFFVERHIDQ